MASKEKIDAVWDKGTVVPGRSPDSYRQDACGTTIARSEYGNTKSSQGWEMDHIRPGGGDDVSNLRPLQHETNRRRGDGPLDCSCR